MTRSRYGARYDIAEDRDILKWYHEGKGIYSIANELNRTPNAIKRRIDETIIPLQNATPVYNTYKPQQPLIDKFQKEFKILDIVQPKPQVHSQEDAYIQSIFKRFNTTEEATRYLLKHPFIAPPQTPPKSSWRWW